VGIIAERLVAMGLAKRGADDWQARLSDQEARMHQHMPTSQEAAMTEAKKRVAAMRQKAYILGYSLRGMAHPESEKQLEELSGMLQPRQETVSVPALKSAEQKTKDEEAGKEEATKEHKPHSSLVINGRFRRGPFSRRGQRWDPADDGHRIIFSRRGQPWDPESDRRKEAGLMSALTEPITNYMRLARHDIPTGARLALGESTRVTSDPTTLPGYGAAAATAVPQGFQEGVAHATEDMTKDLHSKLDSQLEEAKQQFEAAMASEHAGAKRASAAGCFIDRLFEKHAAGELNQILNAYLVGAGVLGTGGYMAGEAAVKGRLPAYARHSALKELARQRQPHAPVLLAPPKELEDVEPEVGGEQPTLDVQQPVTA
jgi:hypothetical protein